MPLYKSIEYVVWLWYVSTYVPTYASLQRYWVCYLSVVYVYIRAGICFSTEVFSMLYACGMCLYTCQYMTFYKDFHYILWLCLVLTHLPICASLLTCGICLHTCRYMPLYKYVWFVLCLWDVFNTSRYMPLYRGIEYVLCRWYVSTYVLIWASLYMYLVCYMAMVCVYIRDDICLYTYVLSMIYGYNMSLQTCWYMLLCNKCVSTCVFGMLYDCGMCLNTCR